MDMARTMLNHVSRLFKSGSVALWKISRMRNIFNQTTGLKLLHAFVATRMDYCHSLQSGLPSREINQIQIIQNSAVRLVTKTRKYDHITPILQGLHWLPVHQRIKFRLICTTYKTIYGAAPTYLNELLSIYTPPRILCSNSTGGVKLNQPIKCNKFYGEHAFSVSVPRHWNSLPLELCLIHSYSRFMLNLKTHLFDEYYFA